MATQPIAAPQRKRRRRCPSVPGELRKEITAFARGIGKSYHDQFSTDPKLKHRATRLMLAFLPPRPRRGRPRDQTITHAILLHRKFRRQYPMERPREILCRVAEKLIPDFDSYTALEQRALVDDLRNRVKSRRRKHPARKPRRISHL